MADSVGLGAQAPSLQEALQPISSLLNIQNQKEQVKQSQFKTESDYAQKSNEIMSGLLKDPRITSGDSTKASEALTEAVTLAENYGIPKAKALMFAAPLFSVAQHAPQNLQQILANSLSGGMSAQGQAGQNLVPAAQQQSIITDPFGRSSVAQRDQFGRIIGTSAVPSGMPNAPDTGFQNLPAGETQESLQTVQGLRKNANQAALQVPNQQYNANQIIRLADETNTGAGASLLQGLGGGYAALPWTTDSASNYNNLGHYMALQTASLAQSAGLGGTDSARELAGNLSGKTEWTRDSIKSTARTNRALSSGIDLYNRGMENAINSEKNPFAARDFQNKWAQSVDVNSLRLYDAIKNNDNVALKEVVKELGGPESARFKNSLKNVDKIKNLITGQ